MRTLHVILFGLMTLCIQAQSITAPPGRTYQVSVTGQDASGFVISGYSTQTLLTSIGLVNPPAGVSFSITTTTGLSFTTGYNSWTNQTRVSFTGTQANINNALASLKINTGSTVGNVQISVSTTENPAGYFYNPINGHFYRPISTAATYDNAKSLSAGQTFKGQTGYLVTITSSNEESFIITNVPQSNIWFALTDRAQEGYWRIDAGPENGTLIKTANGQLNGNISGQYNNWCGGEPNNAGDEDFAVTKWGGGSCWNDLPGTSNWSNPYIVEFGTWTNPADATFTGFYTANTTNTVAVTNTLTGTVSIPAALTSRPLLTLYRVVDGSDVLVDYKTINTNGTYTFTLPNQNSTYKLVPSLTIQGITSADFTATWAECLNINTPTNLSPGLSLTGTRQWKAADVNKNGILDLGDAFLIIAHTTGLRSITEVLWFNPLDYDSITRSNFSTVNSVSSFTINVATSNVTQNIKYCILGDVNLSHSSN
jgi:hypothetical protein